MSWKRETYLSLRDPVKRPYFSHRRDHDQPSAPEFRRVSTSWNISLTAIHHSASDQSGDWQERMERLKGIANPTDELRVTPDIDPRRCGLRVGLDDIELLDATIATCSDTYGTISTSILILSDSNRDHHATIATSSASECDKYRDTWYNRSSSHL
jgi:hypothetical protein